MIERIRMFQKNNSEKFRGLSLIAAAVALASIAQLVLILSTDQIGFFDITQWWQNIGYNSSPLPGLILYAISAWIFIKGLMLLKDDPGILPISSLEVSPHLPRFGFWTTSFGLAVLSAFMAAGASANLYGPAIAVIWLISIGLLVVTLFLDEGWRPPSKIILADWLFSHRQELLVMALIISIAFFIRFQGVELHPYSFVNDEGKMGNNGACIAGGICQNIFAIGWAGQPMLAFLPTGISVSIFGRTATAVRLVSVILGTLAVLAAYLFTREVFDRTKAWVAAGLLATLPLNVHFSRLGVDNIIDSLSTATILWLLVRGMKRGSSLYFLAAGILGGLCLATYPGTRLAPILGLLCLGYASLRKLDFLKTQRRNIVIYILAIAITAAPFLGTFYSHPKDFSIRMSTEGIFQNNVFQGELQNGKTVFEVLSGQFLKSSLVFIATSAPLNFFNSPKPYSTPIAAVFFMLGMFYTLWHIKDVRYLTIFIWFWTAIILGSTITSGPPTSQRMLMSTSPLVIITAVGVSKVVEKIPQDKQLPGRVASGLLLGFVLFVGYQNTNFYFNDYRIGGYFEDPTNELTYETRTFISPLHTTGRFYLIAEPTVPYLLFANFNYFSPDVEKAYFNDVTLQTVAALPKDKDALFIATAGRQTDMELLRRLIPGGEWREVKRRNQPDKLLFSVYKVKQSDIQAIKP